MTPGNGGPTDWRAARQQQRMQRRAQMEQWRAQRSAWRGQRHGHNHAVAGIILLIVGVFFLLSNLGFFYIEDLRRYWPVLLIAFGASKALGSGRFGSTGHNLLWGGALMVMGGLLLAQNFGYIHGNIWQIIWPVWLIFLGISFLFRQAFWRGGFPPGTPGVCGSWPPNPGLGSGSVNPNVLNETSVFGGINRRIDSQEFEGGHLSAVFGGIELDLRKANTKRDEIVIEANGVFGGIDLMVPEHWKVTVRGSGIFGGFEDKTHPSPAGPDEKRPHLVIVGSAVFGGVSVRN